MKKVVKPAEREESVYYSDFSGKILCEFGPEVVLKLTFGYGSKFDGSELELHLSDDDMMPVLKMLKNNISTEFKHNLTKELKSSEQDHDDNVQSRDWTSCEFSSNKIDFLTKLLKS